MDKEAAERKVKELFDILANDLEFGIGVYDNTTDGQVSDEFSAILKELSDSDSENQLSIEDFGRLLDISDVSKIKLNKKRFYVNLSPEGVECVSRPNDLLSPIYGKNKEKNLGWQAVLKAKWSDNDAIPLNDELETCLYDNSGIKGRKLPIIAHKGHLLADIFYKSYIVPIINNGSIVDFKKLWGKNNRRVSNRYNIYWQFSRANGDILDGLYGQRHFEQVIQCYLNTLTDGDREKVEIYYEIKAIFKSSKDIIPIGNRIKAAIIKNGEKQNIYAENFNGFDVFIPNISHHRFYDFSYKEGFKRKTVFDFLDE